MANIREQLNKLKGKYNDIYDEVIVLKAGNSLSALCNLRSEFDETFDFFFDDETLRRKYNDWNEEDNYPLFEKSNSDLELLLDEDELEKLVEYYEVRIGLLKDDLICEKDKDNE